MNAPPLPPELNQSEERPPLPPDSMSQSAATKRWVMEEGERSENDESLAKRRRTDDEMNSYNSGVASQRNINDGRSGLNEMNTPPGRSVSLFEEDTAAAAAGFDVPSDFDDMSNFADHFEQGIVSIKVKM